MPARSFRVDIDNTSAFSLAKTHEELTSGAYTDGWPPPPQLIRPGQSISFESESDGVLGGTEGNVIYNVLDFEGKPRGSFYIFWHAPYLGNSSYYLTQSRGLLTSENGNLVAVPEIPGDPADFRISIMGTGAWDGVPNDGDGHNRTMFEVDGLAQGYQTPPPASYGAYFGDLTLATWSGQFSTQDGSVDLDVTLGAPGTNTAAVTIQDNGTATVPALRLNQPVDLTMPALIHRPPPLMHRTSLVPNHPGVAPKTNQSQPTQITARSQVPSAGSWVKHPVQISLSVGPEVVLTLLSKVGDPINSATRRALRYQRFNLMNIAERDVICPTKLPAPR
jgi:hypothetical protein